MTGARDAGGAAMEACFANAVCQIADTLLRRTTTPTRADVVIAIKSGIDAALTQRAAQPGEAVVAEVERLRAALDMAEAAVAAACRQREDAHTVALGLRIELAASERALAEARAVLRQVEKRGRSRGGHAICPSCGGLMDRGEFCFPTPPIGHAPGCALAAELAATQRQDAPGQRQNAPGQRLAPLAAETDGQSTKAKAPPSDVRDISDLSLEEQPSAAEPGPAPVADSMAPARHIHPLTGDAWDQDRGTGRIVEEKRAPAADTGGDDA